MTGHSPNKSRHGFRCQRRTHHHNPQIGPQRLTNSYEHPQHKVHLDRPLVKLIDHDRADIFERHVVEQSPQQNAGRHDHQARIAAHARIEADLIADLFAEPTAAKLCDPPSHCPGRQSTRLNQHHFLSCSANHPTPPPARASSCPTRRRRDDNRAAAGRCHGVVEHAGYGQIGGQEVAHAGEYTCNALGR